MEPKGVGYGSFNLQAGHIHNVIIDEKVAARNEYVCIAMNHTR